MDLDAKRRLVTRNMRTRKIAANWKVAPLYATAALLARWCNKCLNLPLIPFQLITKVAQNSRVPRLTGGVRNAEAWTADMKEGEAAKTAAYMQDKWKRSATTGSFRRR